MLDPLLRGGDRFNLLINKINFYFESNINYLINDFFSSRVNTPYSEDFMHRRTQSLDSVSSGHSSGSGSTLNDRERESTRRRILVRPYEDPEKEETTTIFKM